MIYAKGLQKTIYNILEQLGENVVGCFLHLQRYEYMKVLYFFLCLSLWSCTSDRYCFEKITSDIEEMKTFPKKDSTVLGEIKLSNYFGDVWDSIYYFGNPSSYIIKGRELKKFGYYYEDNYGSELSELYFIRKNKVINTKVFNPRELPLYFRTCSYNNQPFVFYPRSDIFVVEVYKGTLRDFYMLTEKNCFPVLRRKYQR